MVPKRYAVGEYEMNGLLNLEILYERLLAARIPAEFVPSDEMPALSGFFFYPDGQESDGSLAVCLKSRTDGLPAQGSLLLAGDWDRGTLCSRKGYIYVPSDDLCTLVNVLERTFVYYAQLEKRLREVLYENSSLHEICQIGVEHFQTTVFVHDENFYILACPTLEEGKTFFDYDTQMESYMQDEWTLTMFRTSPAYQETLKTRGGQFWESDFNDDHCLYCNLWIDPLYKGRLIVTDREATAGKLREVGYFGEIARQALINNYMYRNDVPGPLKGVLIDALNGVEISREVLCQKARLMSWDLDDRYVCGMIAFGAEEISRYLAFGVCNMLHQHIQGIYPCSFNNAIYFIVNLSAGNLSMDDLRMQMSLLIRESLLHVGVSNMFCGLENLPIHLKQAEIALLYSREKNRTSWYNEFRENVLQYWMIKGLGELTRDSIIAGELTILKNYDAKNGTDLYGTLKVYLTQERNSTLTAQLLDIHRSTLPYRLDRIEKMTGLNLDDFKTRLYLLMSFALEDEEIIAR